MSRIYDNQPLKNLPVVPVSYPDVWQHEKLATTGSEVGLLLEGVIQKRSHFLVTDSTQTKIHYYILHLAIRRAHRRKLDQSGKEIEPNFSETKKVSTGYLNSSYRVEARGETDQLSVDEAVAKLAVPALTTYTSKYSPPGCASLWVRADRSEGMELEVGDNVRVKTEGNGPFILSIAKLDEKTTAVSNYAGGETVGASWTDKIMEVKASGSSGGLQENVGVDDDEWDD